jgi:hypothetical protein
LGEPDLPPTIQKPARFTVWRLFVLTASSDLLQNLFHEITSKQKLCQIKKGIRNPMKPLIPFKTTIPLILIPLRLACLGLAPMAQAVGPDTEGAIPGSNNGEGIGVLVSRTTGVWNTGTGFEALNHLTAGNQNTATGLRALTNDTNGGFNTATGVLSLFSNTSGFFNSATGAYSLANNISSNNNTANGYAALYRNTADNNTATGFAALYHNTTGDFNTAIGAEALENFDTGSNNTATGTNVLFFSTSGEGNTATGSNALLNSTTDSHNTAIGFSTLFALDGGDDNVALGANAGHALQTGDGNVYIGADIQGVTGESNHSYIRNINTTTVSGGGTDTVTVNLATGLLGHLSSSRRYKEDIKPMDRASEALYRLKPVSYRYKKEIDSTQSPAFG